ncbi:unnamed protein product [Acanthosepion pharaonis]|uniref:Uncharacterized protein n=1 Tax=Acanthosepion pharaonis TaxID=158019 RepID=A0A812EB49_ACAPH|nr:unnamed protein product [Sepia pharaonis]
MQLRLSIISRFSSPLTLFPYLLILSLIPSYAAKTINYLNQLPSTLFPYLLILSLIPSYLRLSIISPLSFFFHTSFSISSHSVTIQLPSHSFFHIFILSLIPSYAAKTINYLTLSISSHSVPYSYAPLSLFFHIFSFCPLSHHMQLNYQLSHDSAPPLTLFPYLLILSLIPSYVAKTINYPFISHSFSISLILSLIPSYAAFLSDSAPLFFSFCSLIPSYAAKTIQYIPSYAAKTINYLSLSLFFHIFSFCPLSHHMQLRLSIISRFSSPSHSFPYLLILSLIPSYAAKTINYLSPPSHFSFYYPFISRFSFPPLTLFHIFSFCPLSHHMQLRLSIIYSAPLSLFFHIFSFCPYPIICSLSYLISSSFLVPLTPLFFPYLLILSLIPSYVAKTIPYLTIHLPLTLFFHIFSFCPLSHHMQLRLSIISRFSSPLTIFFCPYRLILSLIPSYAAKTINYLTILSLFFHIFSFCPFIPSYAAKTFIHIFSFFCPLSHHMQLRLSIISRFCSPYLSFCPFPIQLYLLILSPSIPSYSLPSHSFFHIFSFCPLSHHMQLRLSIISRFCPPPQQDFFPYLLILSLIPSYVAKTIPYLTILLPLTLFSYLLILSLIPSYAAKTINYLTILLPLSLFFQIFSFCPFIPSYVAKTIPLSHDSPPSHSFLISSHSLRLSLISRFSFPLTLFPYLLILSLIPSYAAKTINYLSIQLPSHYFPYLLILSLIPSYAAKTINYLTILLPLSLFFHIFSFCPFIPSYTINYLTILLPLSLFFHIFSFCPLSHHMQLRLSIISMYSAPLSLFSISSHSVPYPIISPLSFFFPYLLILSLIPSYAAKTIHYLTILLPLSLFPYLLILSLIPSYVAKTIPRLSHDSPFPLTLSPKTINYLTILLPLSLFFHIFSFCPFIPSYVAAKTIPLSHDSPPLSLFFPYLLILSLIPSYAAKTPFNYLTSLIQLPTISLFFFISSHSVPYPIICS